MDPSGVNLKALDKRLYNTFSMRQVFEYTFAVFDPALRWWRAPKSGKIQDPYRRGIVYPSSEEAEGGFFRHMGHSMRALQRARLLVLTLGLTEIGPARSLAVGLAQGLAIVPGISRSGSTIATGATRTAASAARTAIAFEPGVTRRDPSPVIEVDGDRTDLAYMNTLVTRGTGEMVVTATGMNTEIGRIAHLLDTVVSEKSPLQKQIDQLTKVLAYIALAAMAFVIGMGLIHQVSLDALLLTAIAMAVA